VGEMLEVWGVDSLQEMLDTPSLQHPSQVVGAKRRNSLSPYMYVSRLRCIYIHTNDP